MIKSCVLHPWWIYSTTQSQAGLSLWKMTMQSALKAMVRTKVVMRPPKHQIPLQLQDQQQQLTKLGIRSLQRQESMPEGRSTSSRPWSSMQRSGNFMHASATNKAVQRIDPQRSSKLGGSQIQYFRVQIKINKK